MAAVNAPAFATETWNCSVTSLIPQNKGHVQTNRIQIDGDKLEFEVLADKSLVKDSAPQWIPFFEYRVLSDNDVGIVAALSHANSGHATGISLGAWVLTIVKPSGGLRIGSVDFTGKVSDDVMGQCKRL